MLARAHIFPRRRVLSAVIHNSKQITSRSKHIDYKAPAVRLTANPRSLKVGDKERSTIGSVRLAVGILKW